MTLINVASSVILEDEDYGLKVSMNVKITGLGSSAYLSMVDLAVR